MVRQDDEITADPRTRQLSPTRAWRPRDEPVKALRARRAFATAEADAHRSGPTVDPQRPVAREMLANRDPIVGSRRADFGASRALSKLRVYET